ncbi:hypothetical protein I552_7803 [Mycobacterium xenopi 3993]|nr:hypothetical protein I552_7803 [Mycobacterium xenopi 3993]
MIYEAALVDKDSGYRYSTQPFISLALGSCAIERSGGLIVGQEADLSPTPHPAPLTETPSNSIV